MTSRTSFSLEKLRSYLGMALAVAAGGALGALLRWALSTGWTSAPGTIAWSVLLINVVGSALLGVVTVSAARRLPHRPAVVAFLGTGLLGGFTTFSTVMVLSLQLANEGHPWLASLQVLLNVLLSVLAAVVAMFCTTLALDKRDAKRGLPTELSMDSDESAEEVLASDGAAAEADDRAADGSGAEAGDGAVTDEAAEAAEAPEATEATEATEAPEAELYPAEHAPIEDLQDDDSELFTESYDAEELLAVDRAVRADQSNHTQAARQDSRARQAEPVAHRASVPAPMVEAVREPQPVDAEAANVTDTTGALKTPEVHKSPVTTKAPQAAESVEPTAAPAKDVAPEPRAATTRHASPAATPTSSPRAGRHSHAKPRPLMANGKPEPELYLPDLDFDSEAFAFPGTAEFPVITFDEDGEVASRHSRRAVPEGQAGTVTDLAARLAAAHATENEEDK
ncbi:MAG: CrcB family protein [Lawsonella sp.]|uniref:CrcB family protein n=1 Tax=Lawsonella sp. TaxID=2041415 RepID=UPI002A7628D7|nr:CrcB family protein [Lawsonella sp.]MDY2978700.1 CrcB family protein [Lawsonella sp.]